jgi:hypothetical protein
MWLVLYNLFSSKKKKILDVIFSDVTSTKKASVYMDLQLIKLLFISISSLKHKTQPPESK